MRLAPCTGGFTVHAALAKQVARRRPPCGQEHRRVGSPAGTCWTMRRSRNRSYRASSSSLSGSSFEAPTYEAGSPGEGGERPDQWG